MHGSHPLVGTAKLYPRIDRAHVCIGTRLFFDQTLSPAVVRELHRNGSRMTERKTWPATQTATKLRATVRKNLFWKNVCNRECFSRWVRAGFVSRGELFKD